MAIGTISVLKRKKGFGYIAYEDPENIQFQLSDLAGQHANIQEGNIVEFSIATEETSAKTAINIQRIAPSALDYMRLKFEAKQELTGMLNKAGTKYRVKDADTQLNIPLVISKFEEGIDEHYEALDGTLVKYRLVSIKSNGMIKAVLVNRKFQNDFLAMIGSTFHDAKIQMRSKGGFAVTLQNGIIGFLPNSLAERTNKNFQPNDSVNLVCTGYSDNHDTLMFDTYENAMNDAAVAPNNAASEMDS